MGMRLTPKDEDFTLYETGFGDDLLERKASGTALSNLVERIDDPMVIALDGGWGTGKSWFLQRWVGQHRTDHPGKARTVYFDAFAHDYLDEPLVALMGVLLAELEPDGPAHTGTWTKIKTAAWKLRKPATRVVLAAGTGGATEIGGAALDGAAKALGKLATETADDFWDREASRRDAMAEFGEALKALTLTDDQDTPRKLVIVVDELDRCRPDYALSLLEVIKHFFAVDHVHFVLGVNLAELENMVRVRYGTREGAELYLQKFVTLTMELPDTALAEQPLILEYFDELTDPPFLNRWLVGEIRNHLQCILPDAKISLRTIDRLYTQITIFSAKHPHSELREAYGDVLSALMLARVVNTDFYQCCLKGKMDEKAFQSTFANIVDRASSTNPHIKHFRAVHFSQICFNQGSEANRSSNQSVHAKRVLFEVQREYLNYRIPGEPV